MATGKTGLGGARRNIGRCATRLDATHFTVAVHLKPMAIHAEPDRLKSIREQRFHPTSAEVPHRAAGLTYQVMVVTLPAPAVQQPAVIQEDAAQN